ncbi:hypothetical protein N7452_010658 [Penicillium brevicompactum]|uniref:BTB domain-containing protein n=1 Tax=Penicillium brevicompactum TaxID=5074 RepID=A0A9W9U8A5_PENBR|nr:hypothetical protein N7452_010658 [Penicillium brevicompactum]
MGQSPIFEMIAISKRELYAEKVARDEESQPLSYYEEDERQTLVIRGKPYVILKCHVEEYPLLVEGDIHGTAGHTVVHFLYTGNYQTIDSPPDSPLELYVSFNEREFQRSVYVYLAARNCHLSGLITLACERIVEYSTEIPMLEVLRWTAEIFPKLPKNEVWLQTFVGTMLRRSAKQGDWNLDFDDMSKMLAKNHSFFKAISNHMFDHLDWTAGYLELFGTERRYELAKILRLFTKQRCVACQKRPAPESDAAEKHTETHGTANLEESQDQALPDMAKAVSDRKETTTRTKRRRRA